MHSQLFGSLSIVIYTVHEYVSLLFTTVRRPQRQKLIGHWNSSSTVTNCHPGLNRCGPVPGPLELAQASAQSLVLHRYCTSRDGRRRETV